MGLVGNPRISERLRTVSGLIERHGSVAEYLELERDVLKAQLEIEEDLKKGALTSRPELATPEETMVEALKTKTPLNRLIDPSMFDSNSLHHPLMSILTVLSERSIGGDDSKKLLRAMRGNHLELARLIEAILVEDETTISEKAAALYVQPSTLFYAVSSALRPYFEEIARRIDSSLLDRWWEARCPVCGRIPQTARVSQRKRHLVCGFCGAEHLSDDFLCVHCGNRDPSSLKYLRDEKQPQFRIDYCTKCEGYLKVLGEDSVTNSVPKGFEDILTLGLDLVAAKKGLKRH